MTTFYFSCKITAKLNIGTLNKPLKPSSSAPNHLTAGPASLEARLHGRFRNLIKAALALTALNVAACGDEPHRGASCVTIVDHNNEALKDCEFGYNLPDEGQANPCVGEDGQPDQNQLFVYAEPGTHRIRGKCGTLNGFVDVPVKENNTTQVTSRLVGSFGTDNFEIIADPSNYEFMLNDHLCWNNADWCATELSKPELVGTEVVDILKVCPESEDCNPLDGRELLEAHGTPGQYSEGNPKHLTFTTSVDRLADSEEVTVNIRLKQKDNPIQQLDYPVTLRGPVCGNGIIETYERCDDTNFWEKTCEYYGFTDGELECNNCEISTENCSNN